MERAAEIILYNLLGVGKPNVFDKEKPQNTQSTAVAKVHGYGVPSSELQVGAHQMLPFPSWNEFKWPAFGILAFGAIILSPKLVKHFRAHHVSWIHPRNEKAIHMRSLNKLQANTKGVAPTLGRDVFVAHNAVVRGAVTIGSNSSVWYTGRVAASDAQPVTIGANVHVKEHALVESTAAAPLSIGDAVEVSPRAVLSGCTLHGGNFIGIGAHVGEGCVIERDAVVAPLARVAAGTTVGAGELWSGQPAVKVRALAADEVAAMRDSLKRTALLAQEHGLEAQKSIGQVLAEAEEHFTGSLEHPEEKNKAIPL